LVSNFGRSGSSTNKLITLAVLAAEVGIQMPLQFLDSGSSPTFAGVAGNDARK